MPFTPQSGNDAFVTWKPADTTRTICVTRYQYKTTQKVLRVPNTCSAPGVAHAFGNAEATFQVWGTWDSDSNLNSEGFKIGQTGELVVAYSTFDKAVNASAYLQDIEYDMDADGLSNYVMFWVLDEAFQDMSNTNATDFGA